MTSALETRTHPDAPSCPWARAERSLPVPTGAARREIIGSLRAAGFSIDTEQLGHVSATRGSQLGIATRAGRMAVLAQVNLADSTAGCTLWIQLTGRGLNGLARTASSEAAHRRAFEQIMFSLDLALGRLSPQAAQGFEPASYSAASSVAPAGPASGVAASLTRGKRALTDQVFKRLDAPTSGHASRSWRQVDAATVLSPRGVAILESETLQTAATVGTQLVDYPGAVATEQIARVAELVGLLDHYMSRAVGSGVRVELSDEQAEVLEFLLEQAGIRSHVELRLRQRCRTCNMEKIVNPDYKDLVRRNQRIRTLSGSFGGMISRAGISPIVLVGKLMQIKQLDPDYVCPRCQGMHAETVMITFCPSCHERHDEPVLRSCASCGYDFRSCVASPTLWHDPAELAAAAPVAASQPQSPPAWHADPLGEAELRWWDGQAWTGYTVTRAQAAEASVATRPLP